MVPNPWCWMNVPQSWQGLSGVSTGLSLTFEAYPKTGSGLSYPSLQKKGQKLHSTTDLLLNISTLKVMGKLMRKCLVNHLEENYLLGHYQHVFRSGRSCLTQLRVPRRPGGCDWLKRLNGCYKSWLPQSLRYHSTWPTKVKTAGIKSDIARWIKHF